VLNTDILKKSCADTARSNTTDHSKQIVLRSQGGPCTIIQIILTGRHYIYLSIEMCIGYKPTTTTTLRNSNSRVSARVKLLSNIILIIDIRYLYRYW
jgi:hypothetical protein